jgi:hypothetical protein
LLQRGCVWRLSKPRRKVVTCAVPGCTTHSALACNPMIQLYALGHTICKNKNKARLILASTHHVSKRELLIIGCSCWALNWFPIRHKRALALHSSTPQWSTHEGVQRSGNGIRLLTALFHAHSSAVARKFRSRRHEDARTFGRGTQQCCVHVTSGGTTGEPCRQLAGDIGISEYPSERIQARAYVVGRDHVRRARSSARVSQRIKHSFRCGQGHRCHRARVEAKQGKFERIL